MANLHGLLAELGLADPEMHPERATGPRESWIVDLPFTPEPGQCYEVAFGKVSVQGREVYGRVRIRADGHDPSQWFDIDAGRMLDPELQACPVRAFRHIPSPSSSSASH